MTQVRDDPSLRDGVPKSTDIDCPICYKSCSDNNIEPMVCCDGCGHYAHKVCFDVRAVALGG